MSTLVCQPCQNDDLSVEAAGYCVDCAEYLCSTCYRFHCKPQPCRHHVLLDKDSMPQQPAQHGQAETCDKHRGKVMEYFCNNHDYIGCSVCMTLDHTTCEGKSYIPDIASSIPDSDEYKELQTGIDGLKGVADDHINNLKESLHDGEKVRDAVIADILCFRQKLDEALDMLENVVRDEVDILVDKTAKERLEKIKSCSDTKDDIDRISNDLNMSIKYKQFLKLFISVKSAKQMTSELKTRLNDFENRESVSFEFTPNMSILKLLNALETLGTVNAVRGEMVSIRSPTRVSADAISTKTVKTDASPSRQKVHDAECTSSGIPNTGVLLEGTVSITNQTNGERNTQNIKQPDDVNLSVDNVSEPDNFKTEHSLKSNIPEESQDTELYDSLDEKETSELSKNKEEKSIPENRETIQNSIEVNEILSGQRQTIPREIQIPDTCTPSKDELTSPSIKTKGSKAGIGKYMLSYSDNEDDDENDIQEKVRNGDHGKDVENPSYATDTKPVISSNSQEENARFESNVTVETPEYSNINVVQKGTVIEEGKLDPSANETLSIPENKTKTKPVSINEKEATGINSNSPEIPPASEKSENQEDANKNDNPVASQVHPAAKVQPKNPKDRVVVFLKDIAVTSTEDSAIPTICGMSSFSDDRILVCDNENKSIKLVDILTNIVVQTVKTEQSPWDVCEAGEERIAVTFPFSKQIGIYKVTDSVKKDYLFNVDGGCYGIAYANENLFVAFGEANVVKVMDLYGYVLRVLQNMRGEKPIFNSPKHITAGPEGRLFYVSNWGNDSVTCLTALGHVAGIFTDRELKAPRDVAVDSFGLVYVCNFARPCGIQVLTKGLNKVKKLLNKDKAITNPLSLAYSTKGDWLFIGLKGENLKMYKLTV